VIAQFTGLFRYGIHLHDMSSAEYDVNVQSQLVALGCARLSSIKVAVCTWLVVLISNQLIIYLTFLSWFLPYFLSYHSLLPWLVINNLFYHSLLPWLVINNLLCCNLLRWFILNSMSISLLLSFIASIINLSVCSYFSWVCTFLTVVVSCCFGFNLV